MNSRSGSRGNTPKNNSYEAENTDTNSNSFN